MNCFRVEKYVRHGNAQVKLQLEWTPEEFHALSFCIGETCESTTSASSGFGISNMEKEMGKQIYADMKKSQRTPIYDWPRLFKENVLPFLEKVRTI